MMMVNMRNGIVMALAATVIVFAPQSGHAEDKPKDLSLRLEVDDVIHRCLTVIEEEQNPDGFWSSPDYPGLTALVLRAIIESPVDSEKWIKSETVAKGIAFLKKNVKEDGGIYNRGLHSYNTAISLMCLNVYSEAAKKHGLLDKDELSELKQTMIRARDFVVRQQQIYTEGDFELFSGGIGYGNSYKHSDLSNTAFAIQALHETRHLVEDAEVPVRLNWEAAIQFLENTQNLPDVNKKDWASNHPDHKGGFVYFPGDSKAGSFESSDGKTVHRSYGSMSYAGLMSFLYAGVDKDDERVIAAVDWLKSHYTLEENPGMGAEGLYYYYHTMAKALAAYGEDALVREDGSKVDWRKELAVKLVSLHKHPGFWVNENSRWMERDPFLVSAYTLLALVQIYPEL
jgi:squalene-hopene/tetraprenyl-beta-curcumene cyclase